MFYLIYLCNCFITYFVFALLIVGASHTIPVSGDSYVINLTTW